MARLRVRGQHAASVSDTGRPTSVLTGPPAGDVGHETPTSHAGRAASDRPRRGAGAKASPDLALYCRIKNQALGAWRRREPTEVLRLCAKADRIAPRLDLGRAGIHLRAVEECRRWAVAQLVH